LMVVLTMLLLAVAANALGDEKAAPAKAKSGTAHKAAAAKAPDHVAFTPADMHWGDAPPSMPSGAKLAVLDGDPGKSGPFTVRIKMPDGYSIAPHWHPTREEVTVISGTIQLGMGDTADKDKAMALPAGSFGYLNAKMHHYASASGDTEIQIHGMGPFVVHYVNPADDPRHAKK
jgi:quercetin dioxygenase-like cupin family protein